MDCEFCNTSFTTKQALKFHIKTNKKCISSRPITDETINIKVINFECEFCNKQFSQKNNLQRHLEICKKKEIKEIINEVKLNKTNSFEIDEINRLKEELRKLKEKNEILEKNTHDLKDENKRLNSNINVLTFENQIKDEKLKMKDEIIQMKDEQIQRNDEQIMELMKMTTTNNTTNNTMNNNNNITIYAQIDQLKPINEFADEVFKDREKIEKVCMLYTTIEPFCSHVSNISNGYAIVADRARHTFHYRYILDGKSDRRISSNIDQVIIDVFKDRRLLEIIEYGLKKVKENTTDEYGHLKEGVLCVLRESVTTAKDRNKINIDILNPIQKNMSKKGKKLNK